MPTITATISNPTYNYSGGVSGKSATDVPIATFGKQHAFDSISTATLLIRSDVTSTYSLETDDTNNALQLNSTVVVTEGAAYHFRGYVIKKPLFKVLSGETYLQVECWGWDGILAQALPVDSSGNNVWTLESDFVKVTDLPLVAAVKADGEWNTFQGDTLWPDPTDAVGELCYIAGATDKVYTDGAGALLAIDATEIILSTTTKGFVPRGWVQIDDEWIFFDGYDNATLTDSEYHYILYNCVRGCLGTAAATHAEESDVQERLGKQIAPQSIDIENDPAGGTAWEKMRRGADFDVHTALGCFVLPEPITGVYKGTYSIYDEDSTLNVGSTPITLNDVITQMMTGAADYGGPGFVAGDLDLDSTTALIKVNRYDYDPQTKPKYVYDAIQELIASLSLTDEVKFWYKHSTGKFRSRVLQNDTASLTVPNFSEVEQEVSLEDVYSGVLVEYSDDQNLNRATVDYSWHQAAAGAGQSPDRYEWATKDSSGFAFNSNDTETAAGNSGMQYTCDGKTDSKCAMWFTHDPAGTCNFGDYYFGSGTTPPAIDLNRIRIKINSYRAIDGGTWQSYTNTAKTYVMRVLGCDDYDTTDAASRDGATWVDLGFGIEGQPTAEGTWVEGEAVAFALKRVNAIRIVWDYMAGPKTADSYYGVIHDIEIIGDIIKYQLIQLSDDDGDAGDPSKLIASASYEKLRGGVKASSGTGGCPRIKVLRIGASSDAAALSVGRAALLTSLRRSSMRRYKYEGIMPGTPELGITISADEDGDSVVDYTGVLREYSFAIGAAGLSVTTGVVLSASADVIT